MTMDDFVASIPSTSTNSSETGSIKSSMHGILTCHFRVCSDETLTTLRLLNKPCFIDHHVSSRWRQSKGAVPCAFSLLPSSWSKAWRNEDTAGRCSKTLTNGKQKHFTFNIHLQDHLTSYSILVIYHQLTSFVTFTTHSLIRCRIPTLAGPHLTCECN